MTENILTKSKPVEKLDEDPSESCVHYWVIESPTGSFSKGSCKTCGAEKEFKNYIFYSPWETQEGKGVNKLSESEIGINFNADSEGP